MSKPPIAMSKQEAEHTRARRLQTATLAEVRERPAANRVSLAPPPLRSTLPAAALHPPILATPPTRAARPEVQRKMTPGSSGDPYEREAEEVADRVIRMAEPAPLRAAPAAIQRKCTACEEEEEPRALQTQRAPSAAGETALNTDAAIRAARRGGEPLPQDVRDFFEPRFGYNFSQVRVRSDGEAAQAVQARAYTVGTDIVFGCGEYAPRTPEGQRLVAHELTHVVQQSRGAAVQGHVIQHTIAGQSNGHSTLQLQSAQDPTAPQSVPLRLVFYQGERDETPSFQAYANILAANLSAIQLPYSCQTKTNTKNIGSMYCVAKENVLDRAAGYAKCLQQKVEQVHVVSHIPPEGPRCISGGLKAESAKWYLPTAKVVLHGCLGLGRFKSGTASILKQLPGASVYVHKTGAEAGGPLDFYKVTTDPSSVPIRIPYVTDEGIGFTPYSVKQWAEKHLESFKQTRPELQTLKNRQPLTDTDNKRKKELENIPKNFRQWLTLPNFVSSETAVFADTVLADSSGQVPPDIINAAREFKKTWEASQQPSAP